MILKPDRLYKILRIVVYALPALVLAAGAYLILFPQENYSYDSANPNAAKFEVVKDSIANQLEFGAYPLLTYRFIDLKIDFKETQKENCRQAAPVISLTKTYQAFLFPDGDPVSNVDQLKKYLFQNNSSSYPNGSLLHLKPTDEVFLLSHGQKILFPGPEIFQAFGYSFDNLTEVNKSTLDRFPNAENKVFTTTMAHPDGTIFEAYPSHRLYLIADGKKHEIASREILNNVWPKNYAIAASDPAPGNQENCSFPTSSNYSNSISCRFDGQPLSESFGRFYSFKLVYPPDCSIDNIHIDKVGIDFLPEKSIVTVKSSLKNLFASILNRYLKRQKSQ